MTRRERYARKLCSATDAIGHIAPGQCIFIGSGAAEPVALVQALVQHGAHLSDNEVVHILTFGACALRGTRDGWTIFRLPLTKDET